MKAARADAPGPGHEPLYLPDFCSSRAALVVVLVTELTALVLSLAHEGVDFLTDLMRSSLFLLWIGLAAAGLLCALRSRLGRLPVGRGSVAVLALVCGVIAVVSCCSYLLGRSAPPDFPELFPHRLGPFLLRNLAIGFIVTGLVLRYFYVTHQWRLNLEMQAEARVHALQARIRPHFLFNSMNTIASLTRSDPARAESAVQDLADLFRATLSEHRNTITLEEELEVTRTYQRIEALRLGPRLEVDWKVDALPRSALVPGLVLQPLLENAIYHGIEPRPGGGRVTITGEVSGDLITIVVRNPVAVGGSDRPGNRLALANIRERLTLMYGEGALVKAGRFDDEYIVTLRFPRRERTAGIAA